MKTLLKDGLMICMLVQMALFGVTIKAREEFRHASSGANRAVEAFQNTPAFRAGLAEKQLKECGFSNCQYSLLMKMNGQAFIALISSNKAHTVTIAIFPVEWPGPEQTKPNLKL